MKTKNAEKGFTLAEILTAVVLLGILAAMVIPRFAGQLDRAKAAEAANMLGAIRQAQITYRNGPAGEYLPIIDTDGDLFCTNSENNNAWTALGLGDPNAVPNAYYTYCVDSVDGGSEFRAIARLISDLNQEITLNQAGVWSGTSDYVPVNPDGCICGDTCPGPC